MNQRLSGQSTRVLDHDIKAILEADDPVKALLEDKNLSIKRKIARKATTNSQLDKKTHIKYENDLPIYKCC